VERPANLQPGPVGTLRLVEAGPSDQPAGCLLLECPQARAAQFPLAQEERHLRPGLFPVEGRGNSQSGADLRGAEQVEICIQVVLTECTHCQPLGLKRGAGAHLPIMTDHTPSGGGAVRSIWLTRPMTRVDVESPVTGVVWKVIVGVGDTVSSGDQVMVLESMKMEIPVEAPVDGTIAELSVAEGDQVSQDSPVAVIESTQGL
jgi:Pyruvate/oxaloacetate carboxyltransferase